MSDPEPAPFIGVYEAFFRTVVALLELTERRYLETRG